MSELEQLSLFGPPTPIESNEYLPQIDLQALYDFAKEQAQLHWQREFDIEIELVDRFWRSTNGMYVNNLETGHKYIRMSKKRNMMRSWDRVKGTLLHELVHWHLNTTGQPYSDDDIEFAQECMRVGAPISGTKIAQKTAEIASRLKEKE